ncbi:hypothetical protein GCM10011322_37820 [Salinarimonas ramus]|uniref:Uncharacterized protein n=1 Tax=Salinarimonas ramus TaxID=690164 RepID=A0A917QFC1_9HYPH|nr:hypothetical protein GCM10011322_37820 [Salinarimonas ramus]
MGERALARRIGLGDEDDRRRVRARPRPIVTDIGPELAGLGAPPPGVERARDRTPALVVSSAKSLGETFSAASMRAWTGLSRKAARPTKSVSVEP